MEINNGCFLGAHFNFIAIDDVVETGAPLTEETFREWLREIFVERNTGTNSYTTSGFGDWMTPDNEVATNTKRRVKKQALNLLRRFITPSQWQDYNSLGYFSQKDGKGRTWKFKKDHHYPIECDGQQICIDPELGAPDEDLLLQVWLEIIGGRAEEILPTAQEWVVQYLTIDYPRHHGVVYEIT